MEWVALALLAAAVVAATVLVATGRFDPELLTESTSAVPPFEMPERPTSADVDRLRLGTSVYGYATTEVDAALDARRERLADQEHALANRDSHVHPHA